MITLTRIKNKNDLKDKSQHGIRTKKRRDDVT